MSQCLLYLKQRFLLYSLLRATTHNIIQVFHSSWIVSLMQTHLLSVANNILRFCVTSGSSSRIRWSTTCTLLPLCTSPTGLCADSIVFPCSASASLIALRRVIKYRCDYVQQTKRYLIHSMILMDEKNGPEENKSNEHYYVPVHCCE